MEIEIHPDAVSVARRGAAIDAAEARAAVAARGKFIVAFSGGTTPWRMLRALAGEEVPWEGVHVAQVDERVAPAGHPDRNLTHLRVLMNNLTASSNEGDGAFLVSIVPGASTI